MRTEPDKEQIPEQEEEQSGGILLWLLLGVLLVMLVGGGFAIASSVGLISLEEVTNKARQLPQKITPIVTKATEYFTRNTEQAKPQEAATVTPEISPVSPVPPSDQPKSAPKQASPEEIAAAMEKAKAEEAKNISRLARLYASMKPEEAEPIMRELDDELAVTILKKMEDEQAAGILIAMEPQRAAKLTRLLAGKQKIILQVN